MKYLLLSSLIMLFFSSVSCAPPSESELCGTYVADYQFAREKLVLHDDGTYHQEVTLKSNLHVEKANGTWSYRPYEKGKPGSGYIGFNENFMYTRLPVPFGEFNPNYAHPKPGWKMVLPVHRFLRITIGSSQSILYRKVNQN